MLLLWIFLGSIAFGFGFALFVHVWVHEKEIFGDERVTLPSDTRIIITENSDYERGVK